MEQGLAQLSGIPHVGGAFICDNRGDVIVSSSPAVLATVAMNVMGQEVGRMLAGLEEAGYKATRLDLTYSTWRMLVVDIEDAMLFVVCHSPVDMSLLRMNVDVILARWRQNPDVQRRLQQRRAERKELVSRASAEREPRATWRTLGANGH